MFKNILMNGDTVEQNSPAGKRTACQGQQISDRELLKLALRELDRAHEEIARLVALDKRNKECFTAWNRDAPAGELPQMVEASSRYAGIAALTVPLEEKEYDRGYVWARALNDRYSENPGFLRAYRDLQSKRGEPSAALTLVHELAAAERKIDHIGVRRLEGRIRELSGWIPRIPGRAVEIRDAIPGKVLHLVKESRPYLSNGFTSRSHHNFVAEKLAGLEPIVVTEPGFPTESSAISTTDEVDGIQHVRLCIPGLRYETLPTDKYLNYFAQSAYMEVCRHKPSVIHVSSGRRGYETALVGLALKNKTGLPLVYEVRSFFEANWTADIERETRGEIFDQRMKVEEMCMRAADRVLTIGESMKKELVSRGIPEAKIGIIPNAVDLASFTAHKKDPELTARYSLDGAITFGYVSNMDHYRESQETLIETCRVLNERGETRFRCVLVGDGTRRQLLEEYAKKLGVQDQVIFTGGVDHAEVPKYYSLIDFFVVPRVPERAATYVTPLKPFEAMAMGKPVIVSDLPALNEIVDAPHRGETFPSGNPKALADLLVDLAENPERVQTMVTNAIEWLKTERTWALNGKRYVEEFSLVLGTGDDKDAS
ncbi:glycosyltransferase family 4 protein [Arthrobacter koreensis]|uniref:glycosyltransferase family 4 protein n=1 Tax=Arthrobacter koreensis TaxID=199136 RepID=UPI0036DBC5A7